MRRNLPATWPVAQHYAEPVQRVWGFIPFAVVTALHLASLAFSWWSVQFPTKALLMPSLLVALLVALPRVRSGYALWGGLALVFAAAGDILLGAPGELGFLDALGGFLLSHVAYIVLYVRPLRTRRPPWIALGYAVWWLALVVVLAPHGGALAIPVSLYGVVLCAAAAASLGTTRLVATGALLFLISDTVLAFRMFYPGFEFWQQDFFIMLAYTSGQGLIILGTVLLAQKREAASALVN